MKVTDDKSDIILFYNSTGAGVDVLDKCIRTYSCWRGTQRRPMAVLFNLIDIAAYNAYILFRETTDQWAKQYKKEKRKEFWKKNFLKELSRQLCIINIKKRAENSVGLYRKYIDA